MPKGFERQSPDKYIAVYTFQQPGSVYMVNGQRYEEPGQTFPIQFVCELMGAGAVISEDHSEEPFELVNFSVEFDEHNRRGIGVSVYYNQPTEFDNYLKQIFKI